MSLVRQPAPAFNLPAVGAATDSVSLDDYKGKWLLMPAFAGSGAG